VAAAAAEFAAAPGRRAGGVAAASVGRAAGAEAPETSLLHEELRVASLPGGDDAMKTTGFALVLGLSVVLMATAADARNDRLRMPLSTVLSSPQARARLDPNIALYFGKQPYSPPADRRGVFSVNEKTNFFNKTDEEGCNWVFLSAARALQEHARRQGGNAVVDIISNYKNQPFSSETEFECGAGNVVGGVALRGEVVILR
jgi:hypothetical protein